MYEIPRSHISKILWNLWIRCFRFTRKLARHVFYVINESWTSDSVHAFITFICIQKATTIEERRSTAQGTFILRTLYISMCINTFHTGSVLYMYIIWELFNYLSRRACVGGYVCVCSSLCVYLIYIYVCVYWMCVCTYLLHE